MPIMPGTHKLGPENATLRVKTKRHGAAAKAGHDLLIEVGSWEGTLEVGEQGPVNLELRADSGSMRVIEGTGGVMALTEEDKAEIKETVEEEVLPAGRVEFESSRIIPTKDEGRFSVSGELTMNGNRHPLGLELSVGDEGEIAGRATVKQSDWGIKPYSGLFGTLKVRDEIEVVAEGSLPTR
jgi:polyisoprenoid-binding protein YceI